MINVNAENIHTQKSATPAKNSCETKQALARDCPDRTERGHSSHSSVTIETVRRGDKLLGLWLLNGY